MVIKKIFEKNEDEEVHLAFLKFGRGDYKDKFLLEGKKQASKWAIKSGPELANFFVRKSLMGLKESIPIKGIIVSTRDLRDEIDLSFDKVSNFKGVRKHKLNCEVEPEKLLEVIEAHPRTFFALSFVGTNFNLKIKAEAAMKDKPKKGEDDEGPKANFCTLKTTDEDLVNELFFDCKGFKEAKISHELKIDEIVYPKNMEELSPTEVREQSKKKGTLIRTCIVDGKEQKSEAEFVA